MLLAERAESERLRQIIKELQRHRFGRRAETLPEEQLQLGLEDVEQVEAAGHAESEANVPSACGEDRRVDYSVGLAGGGAFPAALSSAMICFRHSMPYWVKAVTPSSPTP